jgi:hypothetical protein
MATLQIDRRTTSLHAATKSTRPKQHDIVKKGVHVQASLGTIGAVEYLKANGIASEIIVRVLSGGRSRGEDQAS